MPVFLNWNFPMTFRCEMAFQSDLGLDLHAAVIRNFILEVRAFGAPGELEIVFGSLFLEKGKIEDPASRELVMRVPLLGLPPSCHLKVLSRQGTAVRPVLTIDVARSSLAMSGVTNFSRPLMVTSVGRSGSTFLMQLLGAHPEIAVHLKYPMESTLARKQLREIIDESFRICQDGFEFNSEADYGLEQVHGSLAACADGVLREISRRYQLLHQEQGERNVAPKYYAEKNLSPEWMVWEICPNAREIFLVRDPRDMILSSLAFNRKRGRLAFGRQDVETDLDYVAHRASMARPWVVEPWLSRNERSLLIHYEELVLQTPVVLERIFKYLCVEATPERVEGVINTVKNSNEVIEKHMTTTSPLHSVGRWRGEMTADMVAACNREFFEFLSIFGYPLE